MILIQKQKYFGKTKATSPPDVSGTRLASSLGIKVYTPRIICKKNPDNIVINWGLSKIDWWDDDDILINNCYSVSTACNKLRTFQSLANNSIPCPTFCTDTESVSNWFDMTRSIVLCHTLLSGKQGKGIVVARKSEELVDAPLYTLYIPTISEYKVHVAFNKAIYIQRKARLIPSELLIREITDPDPLIHNSASGYTFISNLMSHNYPSVLPEIIKHSIHAIQALALDYGAVDIIVGKDERIYVLNINTTPKIEGEVLEAYTSAFKDRFNLT